MKAKLVFKSAIIIALSGLMFNACKKEEDMDDNDVSTSADHSFAESTFNDVGNIADEGTDNGAITNYRGPVSGNSLLGCATVSRDTLADSSRVVTIDFGTGCTGADGRIRQGKIIVTYTGHHLDSGASKNVSFDSYFVNDNQILGTRTVTNNGHNASGFLNWTVTVNGSIVLANGAGTVTWSSSRTRTLTEGESTLDFSDNVYSITGTASGINAKGIAFSAQITSPLIRKMAIGCRKHFVQGTIEITPSGKPVRTIDFGTGDCDNIATITVNGHTKQITLR